MTKKQVHGTWTLAAAFFLAGSVALAQNNQEHWVATWVSAQQQPAAPAASRGGAAAGPAAGPAAAGQQPAAAPAPAPPRGNNPPAAGQRGAPAPSSFNNQTVRMIVHTTIPGKRVRVQL